MTDDADDKPLGATGPLGPIGAPGVTGPWGLLGADAQPREPRTAVDAASDPAHGGGPTPIMSDADIQKAALGAPTVRMFGFDPQKGGTPPRTILSGVDRIFDAMEHGVSVAAELDALVGSLTGEAQTVAADVERVTESTVAHVHSAADAVEAMFSRMADLVKRAKAAHG